MQDHTGERSDLDQPMVSPKSASQATFSAESSARDDVSADHDGLEFPAARPRLSPDQFHSVRHHEVSRDSRQHRSASESVSSSVLATPHEELSDRFGSLDLDVLKRDSHDSGEGMNGPALTKDNDKTFAVKQVSHDASVADLEGVDPLDTATVIRSPHATPRRKEESTDANTTEDAVTTSPIRSKLSLLPSALGFAAGLLPSVRSPPTASVPAPSSGKAGATSDSDDKCDLPALKRPQNERQASTFTDTSSVHSTSSSSARGSADAVHETSAPGPSSWRSLTSFLSRASIAPIQESPATPTPGKAQRTTIQQARIVETETPYTSFLLHHITSPSAAADRRRSVELGGSQKLREGFERVKAEMVSAAKELREKEERKRRRDSGTFAAEIASTIGEPEDEQDVTESKATDSSFGSDASVGADGIDWRKSILM